MAVPGPVTSAMSAGCHHEVRDLGAVLVTHAGEIVEQVGSLADGLAQLPLPEAVDARPEDLLDPVALRVLEAVPVRRPSPPVKLASVCGLSLDLVLQRIRQLELLGLVEAGSGGYRLAEQAGRSDDPRPPPRGGA
jgi:DNA processing protein